MPSAVDPVFGRTEDGLRSGAVRAADTREPSPHQSITAAFMITTIVARPVPGPRQRTAWDLSHR